MPRLLFWGEGVSTFSADKRIHFHATIQTGHLLYPRDDKTKHDTTAKVCQSHLSTWQLDGHACMGTGYSCVTDCQVRFAFNNCADICTRWSLPSFSSPTDSLPWQINTFQSAQFSTKRKSIHWTWDQVSAICRRISIKPGILGRFVGHASHSLDTIPTAALDCHWLYCSSVYDEGHKAEAGWTCENAEEEPELLYRNSHGKITFYTEA